MTTQHGGADFRQIFGQHTAAQISASTRRRRFRPAHGDTDAAPKIPREKNLRAEGPQIFFETVSVEQGFMTKKVCFMTEKVFVLMQPVLHVGVLSLIYIEFHVAMNFDKLTKNFYKFPNGPLIQGGFKVFFSVSFVPGGAWAQGPQAAPPEMKKKKKQTNLLKRFSKGNIT